MTNVSKTLYIIDLVIYSLSGKTKDRSVKVNVLTTRKVRIKAGAKL